MQGANGARLSSRERKQKKKTYGQFLTQLYSHSVCYKQELYRNQELAVAGTSPLQQEETLCRTMRHVH